MKKIESRFGKIEYDPKKLLHFPRGLIGLEHLRDFVVMPNERQGPLFWIQSVDDPSYAFVVTDPRNFFPDYQVEPTEEERHRLGISAQEDCFVLAIVTVPPDRKITLNLAAPVLFSPENRRAVQVILDGASFSSQTPLPAT